MFGISIHTAYLCNVFFIVLDLRLTRSEYSGTPFFVSWSKVCSGIFFVNRWLYEALSSGSYSLWRYWMIGRKRSLGVCFACLFLLENYIWARLQCLKLSYICKYYPLDFNTSWPHQIENEKRKNRNNFAISSILVCSFIHYTLRFDANCNSICVEMRGHLKQIMRWFHANCSGFLCDFALNFLGKRIRVW